MSASCPNCGAAVSEKARFCSECGTKLEVASPPPRARKFRPSPSSSGMRAERRQLTVMFCDIADSTKLSERLDPEDLMEVVRRYQAVCGKVIEEYGGSIAQYLGDGLLVYFGYPTAYENAPERAARAGLAILDALDELNEGLAREFDTRIKVRLGIHTGLVVIGEVGSGAKREQLAVGDTANIAARLESLAPHNSGVVSDATRMLIHGMFETQSLGEQELKGISAPMEIHRLLRLSEARHRLETVGQSLTPFVGRRPELERLRTQWGKAIEGEGNAVLLVAEAGVGKSRMIPELKRQLGDDYMLHEAYCSPFYTNTVLHPIVEMLRVEIDAHRDEPPADALAKLQAWLDAQPTQQTKASLPLLAGLLEIPPEAGYEDVALSPRARKLRTTAAVLSCLLPLGSDRPTLIVIEDVHWVDPSTLDLIEQVIARLPEHRAMLLMTTRPTFEAPWGEEEHFLELRLSPFQDEDTRALVLALTEGHRLPPRMLAQLVARTDGIALFVEELTRMLMDAGQLDDTKTTSIPTTLHDSLMARLDRLDPVARKVAQLGATIGRQFDRALLTEIFSGETGDLEKGIDALLAGQLIHRRQGESRRADIDIFIFKHALIQDTAYESLLKRTRQEYHRRIAEALEAGVSGEVSPELLAHHLEAAGREHHEEAARQRLAAAEKAQASSSNEEAISHLERGLSLLPSLEEGPSRVQLELSMLSKLGTALSAVKGYAAADVEKAYARANELCNQLGQTPERFWVLWGLWAFYLVKGDHPQGVQFAELMLELASEQQNESLELEAHFSLGLSFFFMGDDLPRAREHLEHTTSRYDPQRHSNAILTGQDVGVTSHSVSALLHFHLGEIEIARQRHQQALALADTLDHTFSRAYAMGCAAWFQLYMRDYQASRRFAEQTVALSEQQSFGWWLVWGTILLGSAKAGLGEAGAAAQIEQGISLWRQTGSGFTVPYFLGLKSEALRGEGALEEAEVPLEEAVALADEARERFYAAELRRIRAELILARLRASGSDDAEAYAKAEASYRDAIETAKAQHARSFELRAAVALGLMLERRGRAAEVHALVAPIYAALEQQSHHPDVVQARALLDRTPASPEQR